MNSIMSVNDIIDNKNDLMNHKENNAAIIKNDFYHAVYIPEEDSNSEDILRIYNDKLEALKIIKANKTSRLKSFTSKAEAEEFAKYGLKSTNCDQNKTNDSTLNDSITDKSKNVKKHPPPPICKLPTPQELVRFRKIIEEGDLELVSDMAYNNPRYLISCGSMPALLQEGCRYNALHIASSRSSVPAKMCKLILQIITDDNFITKLEGTNLSTLNIDKGNMLLDLFLNTPDKGLNETPLHFAAKFGLKDVVQLLVSYPECVKTYKNKYQQTPVDVICTRKCQDDEQLKQEIRMLIEDQYFVPVLRSEDNSLPPVIGEPFSPASPPRIPLDPLSPTIEIKAFAGPMTKCKAVEFRKKWKTPPRNLFKTSACRDIKPNETFSVPNSSNLKDPLVRLQDSEKGVEIVGRDLAEEYHVPWKEYWTFLDDFVDLRCDEGLKKLESFFAQRKTVFKTKERRYRIQDQHITRLCNRLIKMEINTTKSNDENGNDDCDDIFYTPPQSPTSFIRNHDEETNSDDNMFDAENVQYIGFIDGDNSSKADWAVFNAIPENLNRDDYPYIYLWRHEMLILKNNNRINNICSTPKRRLFSYK